MNWLTNFVRPKIQALVTSQKEVPDNLWEKCPGCSAMLFTRELEENFNVCHNCDYHLRLPAIKRLEMMYDDGQYTLIDLPEVKFDPLKFKDKRKYSDRLKEAQNNTELNDALMVASGLINGKTAIMAVFNFQFMGGSMGMAVGAGLVEAAKTAIKENSPLIVVPASGGARMQEGMLSLMQMPRSIIAAKMVKDAKLPYIVIFTDPTTGGVTASFAMTGDIHIAEKGAQIGFAGARVIETTIRETLPAGFQRSEYLLDHGMIDIVSTRINLKETLSKILDLLDNPHKKIKSSIKGPFPHGAKSLPKKKKK